MADVQAILSQIDVGIQAYMPTITNLQNQFYQNTGGYMQGLFTHSSAPVDENTAPPDRLSDKPTDQDTSWEDIAAGVMPDEMLSRIRIDIYSSSQGKGFVVVAEKIVNDTTYEKHYNVGPEDHRNSDWQEVIEEDLD
tara:strand:+ start:27191 stop:27601 length:411 start_codon:yes stop_codon:yes gene_type:complete